MDKVITTPSPIERAKAWNTLASSYRNTPDWFDLKKSFKDEFLLFVTGNSRKRYWREDEMAGCNYYGSAITWENRFIMKRTEMTSMCPADPLVFNFPEKTDFSKIDHVFREQDCKYLEGEVYGVSLRRLTQIDRREGNGDDMVRIERWVTLRHPIQDNKAVRCFMYVVDNENYLEYYSWHHNLKSCNTLTSQVGLKAVEMYYAPFSPNMDY